MHNIYEEIYSCFNRLTFNLAKVNIFVIILFTAVISLPLHKTRDTVSCEMVSSRHLPVTVICDNLRDPGNMGIIIQSAVAASCSRVLVTKGEFVELVIITVFYNLKIS